MVDPDDGVAGRTGDSGGEAGPGRFPRGVRADQVETGRAGSRCGGADAGLVGEQPVVPQAVDLGQQVLGRPGVVEPDVCGATAGVVAGLGGHPAAGVPLGGPPLLHEPTDPFLGGRVDHHGQVVAVLVPELDQQRDVVDDDRVVGGRGVLLLGDRADAGVRDGLQPRAGGRVGEHDGPQGGPVEGAIGAQHPRPEGVDDLGQPVAARGDDLAGELVGVHDHRSVRGEPSGHGRLARPDATRQPHPQHARECGTVGTAATGTTPKHHDGPPPAGDGPS